MSNPFVDIAELIHRTIAQLLLASLLHWPNHRQKWWSPANDLGKALFSRLLLLQLPVVALVVCHVCYDWLIADNERCVSEDWSEVDERGERRIRCQLKRRRSQWQLADDTVRETHTQLDRHVQQKGHLHQQQLDGISRFRRAANESSNVGWFNRCWEFTTDN